jgi:hypothetical protein
MSKKLSDQQVADALMEFRDRAADDQARSPIWQELVQFPGWGMAQYDGKKAAPPPPKTATEALPDPRLPAEARAAILREQGVVSDAPKPGVQPQPGSMTVKDSHPVHNPWATIKPPPPDGPYFANVRTEIAPPYPGNWRRTSDGWFRES